MNWLYDNIPFIQIQGDRINVFGGLWIICMTLITYSFLRKVKPFSEYKRKVKLSLTVLISFLIPLFYYKIMDSFFMVAQILSGHEYMVTANSGNWNWPVYWFTTGLLLICMVVTLSWIVKTFGLKQYVTIKISSVLLVLAVVGFWVWQLTFYPYDYAVLSGLQRVDVFWHTYPELFFLYAILYISFWRGSLIKVRE